ncbi:hypothetical protein [Microbacterium hominis]|nr:hypothetical protein [Microbacterium hominis]
MLYPGARFAIINDQGERVTLGTIVSWVSLDGDLLLELEDE